MLKITRIYNQNRFRVWTIAIIILFIIAMIQLFNNAYRDNEKIPQDIEENEEVLSNIVDYNKSSQSAILKGSVEKEIREEIQKTIENFIVYCLNNQVNEAYALLTDDCKEILYPSIEMFKEKYCENIHIENGTYSFQFWTKKDQAYTYLVKIFEDMLSTGRNNSENYIQDYITVVRIDGKYMLNINKFIKTRKINQENTKQNVKFKVIDSQVYIDYEIYQIEIKNNTDKEIIIDPLKEDNSTYVQNRNSINIRALLYENKEEEFKIAPGETKQISIKFNNSFIASNYIKKLVFSSVVIDEEKYNQDNNSEEAVMQVEINVDV